MNAPMFDLPDARHAPIVELLSADQRRTVRQRDALAARQHPLALAAQRPIPLHDQAAPADDPKADGLRCGACRWRLRGHYPKCVRDGMPRTRGDLTTVRAWWPACVHFDAKEADGQ